MGFGDLHSADGLRLLNTFLADKSYIGGYRPTQGDVVVFEAVSKAPANEFENALRWYKHIASFNDAERATFQGERKSLDQYGRVAGQDSQVKQSFKSLSIKPAKEPIVDTDDIDLFGDEDEEESELTKQRLAAYAEKKAQKPAVVNKSEIVFDIKPWDDETNMEELERSVRSVQLNGLLWGFFSSRTTCIYHKKVTNYLRC